MSNNLPKREHTIVFNYQGWERQTLKLDEPITEVELLEKLNNNEWFLTPDGGEYIVNKDSEPVGFSSTESGDIEYTNYRVVHND